MDRKQPFDDAPQWYWAARLDRSAHGLTGKRFVVASGQATLRQRIEAEVSSGWLCDWTTFGPRDGAANLSDCLSVLITACEQYGVSLDQALLELKQVPVFAHALSESCMLGDFITAPVTSDLLPFGCAVECHMSQRLATSDYRYS